MENATIPANGEAMPKSDPLLEAIQAYRDGMDDYNANAPSDDDDADAYAAVSYAAPIAVLDNWTEPARTKGGAIAALELALEEHERFASSSITVTMTKAVIGYLCSREGSS